MAFEWIRSMPVVCIWAKVLAGFRPEIVQQHLYIFEISQFCERLVVIVDKNMYSMAL